MKQLKLAASLFISASLASSIVLAAKEKDAALESAYNWTGFYAGLNLGALKNTLKITDNQATTFLATIEQISDPNFTGGLQIGYRRQLEMDRTSGVFGLEFSADFADARFKQTYGSPFALYQLNAENELKDVLLLQLIGGIAANKTFVFLAAGFSWINNSGSVTNTDGVPFFNSFSLNNNAFGTAVGAGVEYAFTHALSARIKVDVISPNTTTNYDNTGDGFQIANSVVQGTFGVNYRFG